MRLIFATIAVLAFVPAAAGAQPAPGVERETHRVVILPGATHTLISELGGPDDTIEITLRHRGRKIPWLPFSDSALVWWCRRFTASATNDGERTRMVLVNTSRYRIKIRVLFDLLPSTSGEREGS